MVHFLLFLAAISSSSQARLVWFGGVTPREFIQDQSSSGPNRSTSSTPEVGSSITVEQACNDSSRETTTGAGIYECGIFADENLKTLSSDQLKDRYDKSLCQIARASYVSWHLLHSPELKVRRVAYEIQLESAANGLGKTTPAELAAALQSAASEKGKSVAENISKARDNIKERHLMTGEDPVGALVENASVYVSYLCLNYKTPGCTQALVAGLQQVQPVWLLYSRMADEAVDLAVLSLWDKVMFDPAYIQGAAVAALKIQGRIEAAQKGQPVEGNLYDDLDQSYLAAGALAKDAERMSWDLLGLYGSRGASLSLLTGYTFITPENAALGAALKVITAATSYLDGFTTAGGHPYSYPKSMHSSCTYGKPYHFWFAAYLAHWLKENGSDSKSSALASHLMGLGYEYMAKTPGRDPKRAFKAQKDQPFSNANNGTRMNMAFNDAGAVFGSRWNSSEARDTIDIDQGLAALLQQGNRLPTRTGSRLGKLLPENQLSHYRRWRMLFAPDAAYDLFLKK